MFHPENSPYINPSIDTFIRPFCLAEMPSIYPHAIYLSIHHLSTHISTHTPHIYPSIIYLPIYLPTRHISIHPSSIYPSIYPHATYLSIHHLSTHLSTHTPHIYPSTIYLPICYNLAITLFYYCNIQAMLHIYSRLMCNKL